MIPVRIRADVQKSLNILKNVWRINKYYLHLSMICNKCKIDKGEEDFPFKNKKLNKRSTICQICQREYKLTYYRKNKKSHYKRNYKTREKIKEFLILEKSKGCVICKENCIPCLEFHHLDPESKRMNVATMFLWGSLNKVREEINKCILLCANCHRKVHYNLIDIENILSPSGSTGTAPLL